MERCRMCERDVRELHPIPPAVMTRTVIELVDDSRPPSELRLCSDCINRLIDGEAPADIVVSRDPHSRDVPR
jgi:hypothetical protein